MDFNLLPLCSLFFFIVTWGLHCVNSTIPNLKFISVHMGNNPNSGFLAIRPAIQQALEEMNKVYPGLVQNYTYLSKDSPHQELCGSTDIPASINDMESLSHYESVEQSKILIAARCIRSYAVVGDFAREFDFLSMPCQSEEFGLHNHQRFPTTISFAPAGPVFVATTFVQVMEKFGWKTITVIKDQVSQSPIAIILSCTTGQMQRKLLAKAQQLGMTKGDYVFIHSEQVETFPSDEALIWQKNEAIDEAVLQALQSTLIIRTPAVPWSKFSSTLRAIQESRQKIFGFQNGPNMSNEIMIACMEAVWAVWQVLNDTCIREKFPRGKQCRTDGRFLARHLTNRTFSLPLRNVTINSQGFRVLVTEVHQWDIKQQKFQIIFSADMDTQVLNPGFASPVWLLGYPPPDRPFCGLHGQICQKSSLWIYLLLPGTSLFLMGFAAFLYIRFDASRKLPGKKWWVLSHKDISQWSTSRWESSKFPDYLI